MRILCQKDVERSFGVVKALVQNGHADIYHTDILGRSALHHAAIGGFALIGSFLIGMSGEETTVVSGD